MHEPLTADEIAAQLVIPVAIIRSILTKLTASHIIVEFKAQDENDEVYQPAVDTDLLTTAFVINALEQCGQNHLPDLNQERIFLDTVNDFKKMMESSARNCLLKDI